MQVWLKSGYVFDVAGTDEQQADIARTLNGYVGVQNAAVESVNLPMPTGPDVRVMISEVAAYTDLLR